MKTEGSFRDFKFQTHGQTLKAGIGDNLHTQYRQ